MIELLIEHDKKLYQPTVVEGITWTTDRQGSPSSLKFKIVKDGTINIAEGDAVRFKYDNSNVFFGFVFTKKRTKDNTIDIVAYDQLRYLTNKDTYVYENKKASDVIKMVANDFNLNLGTIEDTSYIIPSRVEDNTSLFDIIQNALDLELQNKSEMFFLYDDFGKLSLKNIASMKLDILIDKETTENFDYSSSIDSNTYDQIKLTYDNNDTGEREVYIAKDSKNINTWGVLQYFEKLQKDENGQAKADALLKLYNQKTRSLKITNCIGDVRCRAGAMPIIQLNLGDIVTSNYMLIEKAVHTFKNDYHVMSLNMRGGVINV